MRMHLIVVYGLSGSTIIFHNVSYEAEFFEKKSE